MSIIFHRKYNRLVVTVLLNHDDDDDDDHNNFYFIKLKNLKKILVNKTKIALAFVGV